MEGNKMTMNKERDGKSDQLFFLPPNVFLGNITSHPLTFQHINLEICGLMLPLRNQNEARLAEWICARFSFHMHVSFFRLFTYPSCSFMDNVLRREEHRL